MNPQTNTAPQEVRGYLVPANVPAEWDHTRLSLPYDAQSRERIVEQMAREMAENRGVNFRTLPKSWREEFIEDARAALTAIEPKENK